MGEVQGFLLNFGRLATVLVMSTSCAQAAFAAQKYAATVEDGTAKVIQATTHVDPQYAQNQEVFLGDMVVPTNLPPSGTDTATTPTVKTQELGQTSGETKPDAIPSSEPANSGPQNLTTEVAEIKRHGAELETRVAALEQKTAVEKSGSATTYDSVPKKRVAELSLRLKYANLLLRQFGRAYDYRVVTVKDFKRILAELKRAKEKSKI